LVLRYFQPAGGFPPRQPSVCWERQLRVSMCVRIELITSDPCQARAFTSGVSRVLYHWSVSYKHCSQALQN
ncbi:MAG: hypothetical protein QGG39_16320, partial [Candidatus Poribacteria bacterium]|nr:hypothetical protein [Candidatus Poribacteria bacterium]